jgi:hypothetical protein
MDIKKTYEAPSLTEVGSVEGLTLGQNWSATQRDNIYLGWGIVISFPGTTSKGS